ncbi:MAG: L-rhamnose/proton symporter RhaT [Candidatus Sulfotelmatobacter sp.]
MGSWMGILAAGILNGSFAVPMKTARSWSFYHIWGIFSLFSMMLIPCAWVVAAVPGWPAIVGSIPLAGLMKLVSLGLFWGVAALLYGAAVEMLGVALGVSILLGLSIVVGALLPRLLSGIWFTTPGRDAVFCVGLAMMVGGVIICSRAGDSQTDARTRTQFRRGLIVAILGGVGSPLLNQGIEYGISVLHSLPTSVIGISPTLTQWVAWALFLSAAAVTQAGYCLFKVFSDRQQGVFSATGAGADFLRVVIMSVCWSVSIFIYASALATLGPRGASVGWPVFIALIVLSSNAWGVFLGEWRGRQSSALNRMLGGSTLLMIATFLIARAG